MKDIPYPEEIKQEHDKRLLTLNRGEKMYYLIEYLGDGEVSVREYEKRQLERLIHERIDHGCPISFSHKLADERTFYGQTILINGDIVVPREKRVVIEYEVE